MGEVMEGVVVLLVPVLQVFEEIDQFFRKKGLSELKEGQFVDDLVSEFELSGLLNFKEIQVHAV